MAYILLLIYVLCAYIRPYELYPVLAPYRIMLVLGCAGMAASLLYVPVSKFSWESPQMYLMAALTIVIPFSRIVALSWLGGALAAFEEFGITAAIFFMIVIAVNSIKRLRMFVVLVSLLSVVIAVQAALAFQYGMFSNLFIIEQAQADDTYFQRARGTGFMSDPNDFAQSLVMALPFIALAWIERRKLRNFLTVIVPMGIVLYGIYLTQSRGAIVSVLVVLLVVLRGMLGGIGAVAFTGLAAAGFVVLNFTGGRGFGTSDESVTGRIESWSAGLQMLKEHPLFGVGYGFFSDNNAANDSLTAHNSFVLCFSELGIIGYLVWMGILVVTILELDSIRKLPGDDRDESDLRRYARAIQLALYGFLAAAWFLSRTYVLTLYLLIAMAMAVSEIARRAGTPPGRYDFPQLAFRVVGACVASIVMVYLSIKFQIR